MAATEAVTTTAIVDVTADPEPFVAATENVNVPVADGVPDNTPDELRLSPVGNAPLFRENVGDGFPLAVKVYA
jgi:hypothetical protein